MVDHGLLQAIGCVPKVVQLSNYVLTHLFQVGDLGYKIGEGVRLQETYTCTYSTTGYGII